MPPDARLAIVLADGDVPTRQALDAAWPGWDAGTALVIAADGGARHARPLGLAIDHWIGDADSVDPADLAALAAAGVRIERVAAHKDATDTELAVEAALQPHVEAIVVLGGLGGARTDHALANLGLVRHPALRGRRLILFDATAARISLLDAAAGPAATELAGREGDIVSLLPAGATAEGVTTKGLQYPLRREGLLLGRTRGVSNVRAGVRGSVTLESGRLLVIETPVTVDP